MEKILAVTDEIKRVLKKTGSLWWNMGDCYGTEHAAGSLAKYDKNPDRFAKLDNSEKGRAPGVSKCLLMMPERIALAMLDDDKDDIYELKKDLTIEEKEMVLQRLRSIGIM